MAELGKITMEFAESRANQKGVFMEFQPIDIQMKALVERYTKPWCLQCSEYTFTNLFMWGQGEGIRVAEYNGALFIAASWENSPFMFAPLTENPEGDYAAALADAVAYFRKLGRNPPSAQYAARSRRRLSVALGLFWRRTGTIRIMCIPWKAF